MMMKLLSAYTRLPGEKMGLKARVISLAATGDTAPSPGMPNLRSNDVWLKPSSVKMRSRLTPAMSVSVEVAAGVWGNETVRTPLRISVDWFSVAFTVPKDVYAE